MSEPRARRQFKMPSGWYCQCGNPRGFEASVFRAQGLAPLMISLKYRILVQAAGFEPEIGHDDLKGDKWMWVHPALARLIPSGAPFGDRREACGKLGAMPLPQRLEKLDELLAVLYLAGPETAIKCVLP